MRRIEQAVFLLIAGSIGIPIVAAALGALWLETVPAFAVATGIVAVSFFLFRERLSAFRFPDGSRFLPGIFLVIGLLAAARTWGLATFMIEPPRNGFSVLWFDPFYIRHNCFSGWYEGGLLAMRHVANVYRSELYGGPIGVRFTMDDLLYPSPFLLLPRLLLAISQSFLVLRTLWFAIEAALFSFALIAVARWIGGEEGRRVLWLIPAVWLATPVLLTLQIGNFQLAALALTMLALVAFDRRRPLTGGALLGFALFKLFPGIVVIPLAIQRRWRDLIWTGLFAALYTIASVAWLGSAPLIDFFRYQLPRITTGSAWTWLEDPEMAKVVAINQSIPGLMLKAQQAGLVRSAHALVHTASLVYSLIIVVLAVLAGLQLRNADRLTKAQIWIALVGLAALRSPFVPDAYALTPFLWLWSLVLPRLWTRPAALLAGAALWIPLAIVLPFEGPLAPDGSLRLFLGFLIQVIAIAFAVSPLIPREPRPSLELLQESAA